MSNAGRLDADRSGSGSDGLGSKRPGSNGPGSKRLDAMAVGDATTDVFIRLLQARVELDPDGVSRRLVVPFGGKVPFEHAETVPAGGNAANAAVGFARLGLATALVSYVGGDNIGREVLAALHHEGVDARFVRIDPDTPTNRNFVLWYGDDRTILVHHERYDYHWPHLRPAEVPRWLYLSSVGEHALDYHDQLADWLVAEPDVRFAFQPGTFQLAAGATRLARLYRRADVLLCNRQEAARIGGAGCADLAALVSSLHALGPATVVVTDGGAGAYASAGGQRLFVPAFPDAAAPLDRTGAGDAFSSTLVAGLARGLPLEEALAWAPVNAMSVVQHVGTQAGLLEEQALRHLLEDAPASYRVVGW